MKRLALAVQLLTRLPLPPVNATREDMAASMRWFPVAGLLVGAVVAAALNAGALIGPWIGALLGAAAWIGFTGALHLDGLSDLADAMGAAHRDPERFRQVLRDPHVGSFGVTAIALQVAAKIILLHELAAATATGTPGAAASLLACVVLIPFAARIGPLVWARWLPPLHEGLGSTFRTAIRTRDLALWLAALCASALLCPVVLAAPFLLAGWALWLKRRVGGVSGDCHGAGIELTEVALLLLAVIASAL